MSYGNTRRNSFYKPCRLCEHIEGQSTEKMSTLTLRDETAECRVKVPDDVRVGDRPAPMMRMIELARQRVIRENRRHSARRKHQAVTYCDT